mmetsp:Transcript_28101/g.79166  ORF Transcript_28101/g.79166 Transcript_28101/m.79166 type:complete len:202 (+) Transcript_28101:400-1005(+)
MPRQAGHRMTSAGPHTCHRSCTRNSRHTVAAAAAAADSTLAERPRRNPKEPRSLRPLRWRHSSCRSSRPGRRRPGQRRPMLRRCHTPRRRGLRRPRRGSHRSRPPALRHRQTSHRQQERHMCTPACRHTLAARNTPAGRHNPAGHCTWPTWRARARATEPHSIGSPGSPLTGRGPSAHTCTSGGPPPPPRPDEGGAPGAEA